MQTIIIHSNSQDIAANIANQFDANLIKRINHFRFQTEKKPDLIQLCEGYKVDINYLPNNFRAENIRAFVSDMDSTLINIECVDEIADFAGLKAEVANITESAMRGEIDFNSSLLQRVKLLAGLNISVLEEIYQNRLKINEGGENLITFLKTKNIFTALVSGGFDFFTTKLKQQLNLDDRLSNKLEVKDNILTGNILGKIINAEAKADFVASLPYENSQIMTCGDGANDIDMMRISGLSVAYHAKEKVNQEADIVIKFGGLDKIIDLFN